MNCMKKKKKVFIVREVRSVQNKLKTELICGMQMELGGREMTFWEIDSCEIFCRYVISYVPGIVLKMKRCSLPLETTHLRIQPMCNF